MKLGENITKIRKNKNLTQEQFAEELNVSAKTVSSWEKGRNLPSIEVLLDISQKYDISLDELVENNKETKENYKESGINKEIKTVLIIVAIMLVPVIFGIWNMYFYNDIMHGRYLYNNNFISLKDSDVAYNTCISIYITGIVSYILGMLINYILYRLNNKRILIIAVIIELIILLGNIYNKVINFVDYKYMLYDICELIVLIVPVILGIIYIIKSYKSRTN